VEEAAGEVDVLPEQRAQLPHAQSGVHRSGPERAVVVEGREERRRLLARGDAIAAAADGGELEPSVGLTVISPRVIARRSTARSGISVFLIVDGSWPARSRRSTKSWTAGRRRLARRTPPSSGSTRSRMACS